MNNVLDCVNLSKSYGKRLVLDNVNFSVPKGKIYGLLGPNGCGKTTLNKLIAGLLTPDSGEIYVDGKRRSERSNHDISYLPERTYLGGNDNVLKTVRFFNDFFPDFDVELALNMLGDLGIDPNVRLCTLSKGTQEKVQLVLTMARKTKLYILDEPIGGVDPAARDYVLRTIIARYSNESSVLICTHLISDVELVLDDFAFFGPNGRIALSGCAEDVREQKGMSLNQLFKETFRYV